METIQLAAVAEFSSRLLKEPSVLIANEGKTASQQTLKLIASVHDGLIKQSKKFKVKNENLAIVNMNEEQIWEQLNIHLTVLDKAMEKYAGTISDKNEDNGNEEGESEEDEDLEEEEEMQKRSQGKRKSQVQEDNSEDEEGDDEEDEELEGLELESEYEDEEKVGTTQKKTKKSIKSRKDDDGDEDNEEEDDDNEELGEGDIENDQENESNEQPNDEESAQKEKDEDYEEKLDFAEMEAFLDKQDEEDIERDSEAEDELGSDYEMDDGDEMMGEGEDGFKFKGKDDYDDMNPDEDDNENGINEEEDEKLREQDYDAEDQIFDLEREHLINAAPVEEKVHNEDEIEKLEKKLIGDKEWILRGEISSKARPANSLVEQDIDFRKNIKVSQEIDENYNKTLEDIIKQRILDEAFDDRVRVNFEQNFRETFNNMAEISKEKSKQGLGELYEQDFKNSLGLPQNNKEDKLKLEIHNLFREVCYKLDSLSNLSFTPKPVHQQAQISTNVPSIKHEERIPIAVSQADTQRPEEVFNKKKEVVHASKEEMTHSEKVTEHRHKKSAQRQRNKEIEKKKLIKNLEYNGQTKYEYNQVQKAKQNGKKLLEGKRQKSVEFTKSSEFFKNMQNNVNNPDAKQTKQAGGVGKNKAIKKQSK